MNSSLWISLASNLYFPFICGFNAILQVLLVTGANRKFGISDEWFAVGDSLVITVLGQVFVSLFQITMSFMIYM